MGHRLQILREDSTMKKLPLLVLLAMVIGAASASAAYENSSVVGQVPDRVVITLQPNLSPNVSKSTSGVTVDVPALHQLAQRFEIKDMSRLYEGARPAKPGAPDLQRVWAIDFPDRFDLHTVRAAYAALPEVSKAEVVDICRMHAVPNDIIGQQWYLRNMTLGLKDVRAVGGWNHSEGDPSIIIAIVDSGVDWQHPDLGGTGPDYIDGDIWINWDEWYGTPGVDDDTNGKVDDFRGWDFVNLNPSQGYPDEDVEDADNDPMDYESHGTACAGCAAAMTDNGIGIAGTGWDCKVMAVRVGWLPNGEEQGVVRMDFASAGIIYAAQNGAHLINCSWGSTSYLSMAVATAVSEGCIIVTSAGNDNDEVASYLCDHPDVLAVAATDPSDAKTDFSSYGVWVELCAPGTSIYTTWWNQSAGTHTYNSVQGTSFSSPITCGAAGLIWSVNPGWSRNQVMSLLLNSCDNIDALNPGYEGKLGFGRVNLLRALGDSFHKVPDEFPTMLDAMNESAVGDTVAVPGSEAIGSGQTIIAREIHILGGYSSDFSSRDPVGNPTVITSLPTSPAMNFQGGTTAGTVVDGFRCSGGGGTTFSDPYSGSYGGGLVINQVAPTLRNIDVVGNAVGGSSVFGGGGGVVLFGSTASLENVDVHGNTGIYGAGLFISGGAPTLTDCDIYDNTSLTNNMTYPPLGGGMYVIDADLTMVDCTVTGHTDLDYGGGIYATNNLGSTSLDLTGCDLQDNFCLNHGGGIYMGGDNLSLLRCTVSNNGKLPAAMYSIGGGIYVNHGTATLDSLTCQGNSAHSGGGIFADGASAVTLSHSLLTGNTSDFFGGGVGLQNVPTCDLINNTIAVNSGTMSGGGGVYITGCSPALSNNIVAFNTGGATFANGVHAVSGSPTFSCNDVYGNDTADYGGVSDPTGTNGNISADPEFCNLPGEDFGIHTTSPCDPANSGGCGLIGAFASGCGGTPVPEEGETAPLVFKVEQNYPNPFNPVTKIRFSLPAPAHTTVRIYDVAGRLVKSLLAAELPATKHEVTWTGQDNTGRSVAAGIYFYAVKSGPFTDVGRMALVK